jgi:hypothetical protein
MWHTLKRLFAGDAAQNSARSASATDLTAISEPELVSMNQELARAQDAIREQRRAINDELRRREKAVQNATVQGQTLTVETEV